jgi:hypothetical protein
MIGAMVTLAQVDITYTVGDQLTDLRLDLRIRMMQSCLN